MRASLETGNQIRQGQWYKTAKVYAESFRNSHVPNQMHTLYITRI